MSEPTEITPVPNLVEGDGPCVLLRMRDGNSTVFAVTDDYSEEAMAGDRWWRFEATISKLHEVSRAARAFAESIVPTPAEAIPEQHKSSAGSRETTKPDLPPPQKSGGQHRVHGWSFNSYRAKGHQLDGAVYPSWSEATRHGRDHDGANWGASQRGIRQYSTKALAVRAMRAGFRDWADERLAEIDAMIEAS